MTIPITKERLIKIKEWRELYGAGSNVVLPAEEAEELAHIALAAMDAKPIFQIWDDGKWCDFGESLWRELYDEDRKSQFRIVYTAPPAPVVDADDNFYSWFGREWHEHYQQNQYTTAAKQMLGVMAESAWKAGRRAAMLQGADGALICEGTRQTDELVMWIKRLAHSLKNANPGSKLQNDAMEYLNRKGLIRVEDVLR